MTDDPPYMSKNEVWVPVQFALQVDLLFSSLQKLFAEEVNTVMFIITHIKQSRLGKGMKKWSRAARKRSHVIGLPVQNANRYTAYSYFVTEHYYRRQ